MVFVNNLTIRILVVYIKYELAVSLTIFTCKIAIKIIVKAIAGDIKLSPATARKATIDLKKAVLFETTPNATATKVARAACYLS